MTSKTLLSLIVILAATSSCSKIESGDQEKTPINEAESLLQLEKPIPAAPYSDDSFIQENKLLISNQTAFDINSKIIKVSHASNSCKVLSRQVEKLSMNKSPYETKKEHEKRLRDITAKPLINDIKFDDYISFYIDTYTNPYSEYNAETKTLPLRIGSLEVSSFHINERSKYRKYHAYEIEKHESPKETYTAENRFGSKIEVSKFRREICGVISVKNNNPTWEAQYKVTPQVVKSLPNVIGAVIIGKLKAPYKYEMLRTKSPTLDSPYEEVVMGQLLPIEISKVIYFNKETGEILASRTR